MSRSAAQGMQRIAQRAQHRAEGQAVVGIHPWSAQIDHPLFELWSQIWEPSGGMALRVCAAPR